MTVNPLTLRKLEEIPILEGLVILIGPPGAGKSTFAKRLIEQQELDGNSYISNDIIAKDLFGVTIDRGDKDGEIFAEQDRRIAAQLKAGKVAIADATNIKPEARQRLITIAKRYSRSITALCFRRDKATLLKQNKGREVEVPEAMVLEYAGLMGQLKSDKLYDEGVDLVIDIPSNI